MADYLFYSPRKCVLYMGRFSSTELPVYITFETIPVNSSRLCRGGRQNSFVPVGYSIIDRFLVDYLVGNGLAHVFCRVDAERPILTNSLHKKSNNNSYYNGKTPQESFSYEGRIRRLRPRLLGL